LIQLDSILKEIEERHKQRDICVHDFEELAVIPKPIRKKCKCSICGLEYELDISLLSHDEITEGIEKHLFDKCHDCRNSKENLNFGEENK